MWNAFAKKGLIKPITCIQGGVGRGIKKGLIPGLNMNQCYTVKVKLDKEDTHLLDRETDDSLHNLLILSESYGCCRTKWGSLNRHYIVALHM